MARQSIPRKGQGLAISVLLGALCFVTAPALAQETHYGFLDPMGPIARAQRTELIWAAVVILIAVLPVLIGTPIVYWRYRRSRVDTVYRPNWDFSTRLELLQWGVPTGIVIALSVWMTQAVFLLDPYREIDGQLAQRLDVEITGDTVRVDVIGLDWKWLFLYPDEGVASVGEMVIPVGRPVTMRLTTDTVMQSFMAPGLAGQIYAMPGMTTRMSLLADRPGVTSAINTQYNGTGFPDQRAPLRAVDDYAFAEWVETARAAPELDATSYARLAMSGDTVHAATLFDMPGDDPVTFDLTETGLYERVLARYRNGDPVPPERQPGSPVYDPSVAIPPEPLAEVQH